MLNKVGTPTVKPILKPLYPQIVPAKGRLLGGLLVGVGLVFLIFWGVFRCTPGRSRRCQRMNKPSPKYIDESIVLETSDS